MTKRASPALLPTASLVRKPSRRRPPGCRSSRTLASSASTSCRSPMHSTRKEKPPKCPVSLFARGDAAANCRVDNVTYTPSIVYDELGDVFGQRRSFSATELRQYPDDMMEILVCTANHGCSPVTTRSGSNDDVTFRTINAS